MQHPRHQGFLKYVAYLQAIGIILVVFGHSFHEYPDGDYGRTLTVYRMIYSFHMPLFLFVSGFLMVFTMRLRGASRRSWGTFAREKCVRLMIPLVFLSAVAYVPRVLMSHMADEPVELGLKPFVASFIDSSSLTIPYFWFLHVSFLLLLLTYGVVLVADHFKASRVAALALLAVAIAAMWLLPVEWPTVFSVNEVVRLGVYFVAGALFGELSEQVDRYVPWHSWRLFSVLALTWAGLFFVTEDTPWIVVCSFFGIAMCVSLVKILEYYNVGVLDHLIGANYMIFLLSWFCNVATQQVLHHFVELPWWVFTILSLTGGVYLPWLAYRLLSRYSSRQWARCAAFLLGQRVGKRPKG